MHTGSHGQLPHSGGRTSDLGRFPNLLFNCSRVGEISSGHSWPRAVSTLDWLEYLTTGDAYAIPQADPCPGYLQRRDITTRWTPRLQHACIRRYVHTFEEASITRDAAESRVDLPAYHLGLYGSLSYGVSFHGMHNKLLTRWRNAGGSVNALRWLRLRSNEFIDSSLKRTARETNEECNPRNVHSRPSRDFESYQCALTRRLFSNSRQTY